MIKCQPIVESQTIVRNWRWLVMITGFYDTTLDLPGVIVEEAHIPIGNAIDLEAFTRLLAIAEQQPPAYNYFTPAQSEHGTWRNLRTGWGNSAAQSSERSLIDTSAEELGEPTNEHTTGALSLITR